MSVGNWWYRVLDKHFFSQELFTYRRSVTDSRKKVYPKSIIFGTLLMFLFAFSAIAVGGVILYGLAFLIISYPIQTGAVFVFLVVLCGLPYSAMRTLKAKETVDTLGKD